MMLIYLGYYGTLSPNINIKQESYQLSFGDDLKTNTTKETLKKWSNFVLKLPDNPLIHHKFPLFLNPSKFHNLLSVMIPSNFVINVNKSYVQIVKNTNNLEIDNHFPPTIVRVSINPVLILGGGINNITAPSFLIDGELRTFQPYKEDVAQLYLDEYYPHCRKCLKWGTSTANCSDCKTKLNQKRDKIKRECKRKNMSIKQIRLMVGQVKLESVCIRCSKEAHTYNKCSNKPYCKHDGLTHSAGDKQRCEVYKSIRQCLKNALAIHKRQQNPLILSLWQIADYVDNDPAPAPSPKIPKDLQIQIPTGITIKIKISNTQIYQKQSHQPPPTTVYL